MSLRGSERQEFRHSVRRLAFKRCCGKDGIPKCENCGKVLRAGHIEFEHLTPDGLGGEPTLENCGVWCKSCSKNKTYTEDNPRMAKADRVLKKTYGLRPSSRGKLESRGFAKAEPQRTASRPLERRS